MLAEATSGRRVVDGESDIEIFMKQVASSEHALDPQLLACPFGAVIQRAIRKDPAQRYQTATAMRRELEGVMAQLAPASQLSPFAVGPNSGAAFNSEPSSPSLGSSHAQWQHVYPTQAASAASTDRARGGEAHGGAASSTNSTRWGVVAAVLIAGVALTAAVVGAVVVGVEKFSQTEPQIDPAPLSTLTPKQLRKQLVKLGLRVHASSRVNKGEWATVATFTFSAGSSHGGVVTLIIYQTTAMAELALEGAKAQGQAMMQRGTAVIMVVHGSKKDSLRLLHKLVR